MLTPRTSSNWPYSGMTRARVRRPRLGTATPHLRPAHPVSHRTPGGPTTKLSTAGPASAATMVGRNFTGKGVHEASRIGGLAEGNQIDALRAYLRLEQRLARDGAAPSNELRALVAPLLDQLAPGAAERLLRWR